ncbi:50S ribosomal protein L30 [Candidatus Poribacteria bacterium]|nr:50S ribosomal protein L30 [Candidatus Poribacteria bacterium]
MKQVRITWNKSTIGCNDTQRRTIEALGLHHRGCSVVKDLSPQVEGMIRNVDFLLKIEELPES